MAERPAYLQTSLAPDNTDQVLSHLGGITPPYLSIKGNRFTLVDSSGNQEPAGDLDKATNTFFFDCVIVDALEVESRIYYGHDFDPAAGTYAPPDCWSDNGIAPSRNASSPQSPTCGTCPQKEWGAKVSKVSGKGIPACGKYQKLALLPLGEDPADPMAFLLRVPPNSLKPLSEHLSKLRKGNESYRNIVTRISLAADQLGTLLFRAVAYIDEPTYKNREKLYQAKATDQLVGRGDMPREGLPAPLAAARLTAPAVAAARIAAQASEPQTAAQPFAPQGQPSGAPTQTATPAPASQAAEPAAPRRGRERPAKAAEAAPTGQTPAPFRPEPAPNGNGAPFGMAQPTPANAELSAALDSIFK